MYQNIDIFQQGGAADKDLLDRVVEGYEENVPLLAQIAAGFTPPGMAADLVAGGKYGRDAIGEFREGNIKPGLMYAGIAGLSTLGALPLVGDLLRPGKQALKSGIASLDDDMLDLKKILDDPKLSNANKLEQAKNHPAVVKATKAMEDISLTRDMPGYGTDDFVKNRKFNIAGKAVTGYDDACLLYTSPSPRDRTRSRMPSSA